MKKQIILVCTAALMTACATANTVNKTEEQQPAQEQTSTVATVANQLQNMSLDQALEKVQTTRQQLEQAKQSYQTAKSAAAAVNSTGANVDVVNATKNAVQEKIDNYKQQIDDETKAWKELVK